MQRHSHKQSGFTLIEIMIVMVIIVIIMSVVVGADNTDQKRNDQHTEQLQIWLKEAQDTAILHGLTLGVTEKKSEDEAQLKLLAHYQNRWYALAEHRPFDLRQDVKLQWSETIDTFTKEREGQFVDAQQQSSNNLEELLEPLFVLHSTGLIEPLGFVTLNIEKQQWASIDWETGFFMVEFAQIDVL